MTKKLKRRGMKPIMMKLVVKVTVCMNENIINEINMIMSMANGNIML